MKSVDLTAGTIAYEEAGPPDGRPVVCVHGFLMAGDLWAGLAQRLAARGLRVVMPTWPLGAHQPAMKRDAALDPRAIAATIAEFLDALDLENVVLLGNDSGGAISQVVAVDHPKRLGALVLTNCDTFEHFPPSFFKAFVVAAKAPAPALKGLIAPVRSAKVRNSPAGYGLLSHADISELTARWVRPVLDDDAVFEDVRKFAASLDNAITIDAARRLPGFDGPIVLAWGEDDKLFPLAHAERFAREVPGTRLERIPESRTFVMIDQPDRLAEIVAGVALSSPERPRTATSS
jgi:pimeloyl-ACP methyl ester carboxylesterase